MEEEELDFYKVSQDSLLKNGLKLLKCNNVGEAITCFQNYLQYNLEDEKCWINLADAYFLRGSYNTAIKAYLKSIQLREANEKETDYYAELRIASIHQLVHENEDALNDYQVILDQNSDHMPALLGKAETLLNLAKDSFSNGYLHEGELYCQKVINTIEKSLKIRDDLALQYDILSICNLLLINNLSELSNDDKLNTILIGIKNTNKALSINFESQYYWHHLGIFYWHLYQITNEERSLLKSKQACLNSIKINPENSNVWNTLGVIAGDHLAVAQHCFLKSIKLSSASTEMQWSNLGVIYMKDANQCVNLEDEKIFQAHKAFNESQAQNPNFTQCWIGQALIAENVNHSSTLDLLRHCNTLNYHPVCVVRFAYHLLSDTNYHLNKNDLFNLAIDNMHIYIKKKRDDALALNILGCLYERMNCKRTAFNLFEKALQNTFSSNDYTKNCIQINYLRTAAYFKKPEELNIDEVLLKSEWQISIYLCLAHLLAKSYEDAYSCLNHSLQLVDSGSYVYFLIDSLKYLLSEKVARQPELKFNKEMIQTNEPLRTVFIVNSMQSRNYSPILKEILTSIMILPSLIDMILIGTFNQEASLNFAKDFQTLPQTWIKQCLDYLINSEQNAKDDLKEFNRIYRNFISCKDIKPKQLVGYHLLLALNLIESSEDSCLKMCLINIQTAYFLMPFNLKIKQIFTAIRKIRSKELDCKSFFDEIEMEKSDLIVFMMEFLQ